MFFLLLYIITFFQSETVHIVPSSNTTTSEIEFVSGFLNDKCEELNSKWNLKHRSSIEVKIYPTVFDFCKATGLSKEIGGAFYKGKIHLQPVSILRKKGVIKSVLSHELAHVFLDQQFKAGMPVWLNESFAIYFSNEISKYKKSKNITFSHFSDLDRALKNANLRKETVYFYLGLTMQFFTDTYPKEKILKILSICSNDYKNQISKSLNEPIESIEKKWIHYLSTF